MKETGRINEVHGTMITIQAGEIAACFGCMNQECRSNKRMITAENRKQLDLSAGQVVEIEHNAAGALIQFLQAILPPFAGFAAAYLLTRFGFPVSGDGMQVLIGILGLFLTGFAVYRYRKKVPAKNNPYVVKVLYETEGEHCNMRSFDVHKF